MGIRIVGIIIDNKSALQGTFESKRFQFLSTFINLAIRRKLRKSHIRTVLPAVPTRK
jgi:hypothetical protein